MSTRVGRGAQPRVLVIGAPSSGPSPLRSYLEPTHHVVDAEATAGDLVLIPTDTFDLVILDLGPGETAHEICRRIKARDSEAFLPVFIIAPDFSANSRRAALEAGADDVLAHPVDATELGLRIDTFLGLRAEQEACLARLAELQKLDAMKDDLVTLIAHDLRNPVAGLSILLHALLRDAGTDTERRDLGSAMRAVERVRDTLDDMLAVRRLEQATVPLNRSDVDLQGVVRDAVTTLFGVAVNRRITIEENLEDVRASVDPQLLRRALENLLDNAIRYSRAGGEVSVHLSRRDGTVHIELRDRGRGLPEEVRRAIASKSAGAAGLGLQLVSLVTEAHGGRIEVEDRDGGGTVFRVLLPSSGEP